MTGRLPSTSGVYLLCPTRFRQSPALADCLTLPEYFAKHGYATFGCGKIRHNSTSTETFQKYGPRGGFGPLLQWKNLAGDARYREEIRRLAGHLPKVNAEPLPDSRGLGSALRGVPD